MTPEEEIKQLKDALSDVNAEATTLAERASILQAESWGWQQAAETAMAKSGMGTVTACKFASEHRREVERLRGVEAYAGQTLALLRRVEWRGGTCAFCGAYSKEMYHAAYGIPGSGEHSPDCELAAALRGHEIGQHHTESGRPGLAESGAAQRPDAESCGQVRPLPDSTQSSHAVGKLSTVAGDFIAAFHKAEWHTYEDGAKAMHGILSAFVGRFENALRDEQPILSQCHPCPDAAHMGEHACKNKAQCWEPCGELGKSEAHVRVASPEASAAVDAALTDAEQSEQGMEAAPYGWYSPAEMRFLPNEPDIAWKAKDRIRDGYEMIALYRGHAQCHPQEPKA